MENIACLVEIRGQLDRFLIKEEIRWLKRWIFDSSSWQTIIVSKCWAVINVECQKSNNDGEQDCLVFLLIWEEIGRSSRWCWTLVVDKDKVLVTDSCQAAKCQPFKISSNTKNKTLKVMAWSQLDHAPDKGMIKQLRRHALDSNSW